MRILLVSSYAYQASGGWCLVTGPRLAELGHDVTILIQEHAPALRRGVTTNGIRLVNPPLSTELYNGFFFSPLAVPEILLGSYDVIHLHHIAHWGALCAAVRSRVRSTPLLVTAHTSLVKRTSAMKLIYNVLAHFVLGSASGVALLSSFHEGILKNDRLLPARKPVFILPNPVPEKLFDIRRVPRPVRHGVYVGRLETYQKALNRLLPVFDRLRHAGIRFLIAGDGDFRAHLERRIRDEGWEHVEMLGWVSHEELPAVLAKADFFILPSRYETQPMALLEAMGAGLPVVATDIPGVSEFCPREAGYLVQKADESERWVEAILRLVEDPGKAHAMGMEARHAAAAHHPRAVAEAHLRVYETLIGKESPQR